MKKEVVITGFGVIEPPQRENIQDAELFQCCGRTDESRVVNKRLQKKIDNFCINGLIATDQAIKMSGLDIEALNPYDIGISVGNCLGGWGYIEKDVIQLHKTGLQYVSPYIATAWFPAALQGQISLKYGIKGFSKTFSMSEVAGIQAIGHAARAIQQGKCKVMIAGASEDLSSKFVRNILKDSYLEATSKSPLGNNTSPFYADGSVFFILEDYEFAAERSAKFLCEVCEYLDVSIQATDKIRGFYARNFKECDQGICYTDGLYLGEKYFMQRILHSNAVEVKFTKNIFGNRFAVSGPRDIVYAIEKLTNKKAPSATVVQRLNYMERIALIALK